MRRNEANKDLRELIARHGLFMWEAARRVGIEDTTFSKWMREEMAADDPRRQRILQALETEGGEHGKEKEVDGAGV